MPNAPVSVEIAPPESNDALRAALLDACTRTVKDTECVESAPESTPPSVVAIVSFKDPQNVHLEVAVRPEPRWVTRDIRFSPTDPPEERWRAVGLVIGTLASVMVRNESPAEAASPAPPPPAPDRAPAPATEPSARAKELPRPPERVVWLDAAAILGSALDRGSMRAGAELELHVRAAGRFYVTGGGGFSQSLARLDDVQTRWTELFAGVAYDTPLDRDFALVVRGDLAAQRIEPSLSDTARTPASGERWLGGARLGADVYYWGARPLGFFLGVTGRAAFGVTDVRVEERVIGAAPVLGALVRAGVAFEFTGRAPRPRSDE